MDSGLRAFLDVIAEMAADAVLANLRETKGCQRPSDYLPREINRSATPGRMAERVRERCLARAGIRSQFEHVS